VTVYVDDVRHPFGRMIMCHMWADSFDELLAMADRIGVDRRWLQQPPKASWTHFDVSLSCKAKALAAGAVLTDRYACLLFAGFQWIEAGHIDAGCRKVMLALGVYDL
jgi:hypothetical protein